MDAAQRRLAAVREGMAQLGSQLSGIAIQFWDGSTIPEDPTGLLRITFADEGVVAALIKRPSFDTIVRLYALGRLDLTGGSFFSLAEKRPVLKPRDLLSALGAQKLAKIGALFLTVPPGNLQLPGENSAEDLPDAFYALFLDPELVYSCAYFENWDMELAAAQKAKLDYVCRKLQLRQGERFLDVGCGWGALVCHAAAHYGVQAHGITFSPSQLTYAEQKIRQAGLQGRVTVALEDWANLSGGYDKIASIGAFEHVPLARHAAYFKQIRSLLRPTGLYLHQAVTRRSREDSRAFSQRRPEYRALLDHVFPGAEVDHLGSTISAMEGERFEIHDVEGLRDHYARTAEIWCRRLTGARDASAAIIGRERTRLWIAYLAVASLAFRRGSIGVFQTLAGTRSANRLRRPATRKHLYG